MYSANPIGANGSGATGDAICFETFWQSMGFGNHTVWTHANFPKRVGTASGAEFARSPCRRGRVGVREPPLATGDGPAR